MSDTISKEERDAMRALCVESQQYSDQAWRLHQGCVAFAELAREKIMPLLDALDAADAREAALRTQLTAQNAELIEKQKYIIELEREVARLRGVILDGVHDASYRHLWDTLKNEVLSWNE